MTPTTPPSLVGDRFQLLEPIGQGSAGQVYRGVDTRSGEAVAVKFLLSNQSNNPRALARFRREARAASHLEHPGIVRILEFGQHEGLPFLVQEFIQGKSLASWRDHPPTVVQALQTASSILGALGHAHARGIVHRDLKPEHILLDCQVSPPLPRIIDFGLALAGQQDATITHPGQRVGSPAYMAPEQASGGRVGPEADLYALGCILYEVFAGKRPFQAPSAIELLVAKLNEPPPPLQARTGLTLPPGLEPIVTRLLARHPHRRYPLAADVRSDIHPILLNLGAPSWPGSWATHDGLSAITETHDALPTRLLGREHEQRYLLNTLLPQPSTPTHWLSIEGDEGLGRTALLDWLAFQVEETGTHRVLRAGPGSPGQQDDGLVESLLSFLGASQDPSLGMLERVAQLQEQAGVSDPGSARAAAEYLEGKSTFPPRTRHALIETLLRWGSTRRPLLLAIDDLDKASSFLVGTVEHLVVASQINPFPLVIISTQAQNASNPSLANAVERLRNATGVKRLLLPPLSREAILELAALEGLAELQALQIVESCDGNPLYASILCRDQAVTSSSPVQGASLSELLLRRLDPVAIPSTLPPEEMLDTLAVLGAQFPRWLAQRALAESGSLSQDQAFQLLESLLDQEVLEARANNQLAMVPASARNSLYDQLSEPRRTQLHSSMLRMAREPEGMDTPCPPDELPVGWLGYLCHHARGAHCLDEEMDLLRLAAEEAQQGGRWGEAAAYYEARAKRLPLERGEERAEAWLDSARMHHRRDDLPKAEQALEHCQPVAPQQFVHRIQLRARIAGSMGSYTGTQEWMSEAEAATEELQPQERLRSRRVLTLARAWMALERGFPSRALAHVAECGGGAGNLDFLELQAHAHLRLGRRESARSQFRQAMELALEVHPQREPSLLQGSANSQAPGSASAWSLLEQSKGRAESLGLQRELARTLLSQAAWQRFHQELDQHDALLRDARILLESRAHPRDRSSLAMETALGLAARGDHRGARRSLTQEYERLLARKDGALLPTLCILLAAEQAQQGALEVARRTAGQAMAGSATVPVQEQSAHAFFVLGRRFAEGGLLEEARHALDLARTSYWQLELTDLEGQVTAALTGLPKGRGRS